MTVQYRECFFCKGVAHPSTGCEYSENVLACAECAKTFWRWFIPFANGKGRRKGGPCFYEHIFNMKEKK